MTVVRRLVTIIGFDIEDGKLRAAEKGTNRLKDRLTEAGARASALRGKIGGAVAALGALATGGLIAGIVNTNIEIGRLRAQLETVTGSAEKGAAAFDKLSDFAKRTPFQLPQVVNAFRKLESQGIKATEERLTSFGNTAVAMGKDLDQFTEAALDAAVGEFERLKEFGLKAKSEGDFVTFTFRGVSTKMRKRSREIIGFLTDIGNTQFGGAMDKQMQGLGGAFSNLKDQATRFALAIGESGLNEVLIEIANSMLSAGASSQLVAKRIGELIKIGFEKLKEAAAFAAANTDLLKDAIKGLLAIMVVRPVLTFAAAIGTTLTSAIVSAGAAAAAAGAPLLSLAGIAAALKTAFLVAGGAALALKAKMVLLGGGVAIAVFILVDLIKLFVTGDSVIGRFIERNREAGGVMGALAGLVGGLVDIVRLAFDGIVAAGIGLFNVLKLIADEFISVGKVLFDDLVLPLLVLIDVILDAAVAFTVFVAKVVVGAIVGVVKLIGKILIPIIKLILKVLGDITKGISNLIGGALRLAVEVTIDIFEGLVDIVKGVVDDVVDEFMSLVDFLRPVWEAIVGTAEVLIGPLIKVFDQIVIGIKDLFTEAKAELVEVIKDVVSVFGQKIVPDSLLKFAGIGQSRIATTGPGGVAGAISKEGGRGLVGRLQGGVSGGLQRGFAPTKATRRLQLDDEQFAERERVKSILASRDQLEAFRELEGKALQERVNQVNMLAQQGFDVDLLESFAVINRTAPTINAEVKALEIVINALGTAESAGNIASQSDQIQAAFKSALTDTARDVAANMVQ